MPASRGRSAARALRRSLVRFRRRVVPAVDYVYSAEYEFHLPHAPYDGLRSERVLTALYHAREVRSDHIHEPYTASMRSLRRVHTDDYLDRIGEPETVGEVIGDAVDAATAARVLEVQRRVVGGTNLATSLALYSGRVAANLNGGLHHARRDAGAGFCLLNDVAVAIARIRAEGFRGRVLVVDLDLHDGDGTRTIFADDPTVFTYSIHNADWSDPSGAVASFSRTLVGEVEDGEYLGAIRETLPPIVEELRPELVFYLAGADPAADDRLGNWKISPAGMLERDRFVLETVRPARRGPPFVILLAGGYGDEAWRYSARFLSSLSDGKPDEPPETSEVTLMHYRRMAKSLRQQEEKEALEDWGLSEEDLFGALDGAAQDGRFLGRYTRHEIELLLERLGFIDRIREMGFLDPAVDFRPDGEGLTVYGDGDRTEVLIELIAKRDRRTRAGHEFLRIEWLLMQNPRKRFSGERPRLPGQKHPGLGLLFDVLSILIVLCDELELDGILFVPAHFHLAFQGRRSLRALEPSDEAFLRQLCSLFVDRPLPTAIEALRSGSVRSLGNGEPISWRAMPMVLPTSDRLRAELDDPAYEEAVEAARRELRWALETPATAPSVAPAGRETGRRETEPQLPPYDDVEGETR